MNFVPPLASRTLVLRGRCWKFGDNLGVDGDLMPFEFAISRETRLEVLREHAMTALIPDFPKRARPGDIVVAGPRFAQGNPHIQGLLGLRALELGVVVQSIPRGSLRNAINAGVPILPACPDVTSEVETGDDLEVDFATGVFRNLTRGTVRCYPALHPTLLDIIRIGGWQANFERRLAAARGGGP